MQIGFNINREGYPRMIILKLYLVSMHRRPLRKEEINFITGEDIHHSKNMAIYLTVILSLAARLNGLVAYKRSLSKEFTNGKIKAYSPCFFNRQFKSKFHVIL